MLAEMHCSAQAEAAMKRAFPNAELVQCGSHSEMFYIKDPQAAAVFVDAYRTSAELCGFTLVIQKPQIKRNR